MQALTRCQHPVASSEAQNELHRAMRPASHRLIRMTIEIASICRVFFVVVDFVVAHNNSERQCYGPYDIKPSYTIVY